MPWWGWVTVGAMLLGAEMFLIDGAAFDWLEKLCSNQRAVYVASGAGAQLIEQRFRRPA